MEQIDVLKFEEDLKKGRLKRMMHDRSSITAAIIGVAQIPTMFINDIHFFRAMACFVAGIEIATLKRHWKRQEIIENAQTIDMLRSTTTYNELKSEYEQYVKDVAELIRYVGLKSAKEVVMYLQGLMELGYFSKGMKHQYQLFKHENDYLVEVSGAKVLTGTSVCRHMAAFFVDVVSQLGYTAANQSATPEDENPVRRIQKKGVIIDHAVATIVEDGQRFLFDPTCGFYAGLPQDFDFTDIESIHVSQYVTPNRKKYLIMCPDLSILNYQRPIQCGIVNQTKLMTITPGEVEYIRDKIQKVLNGNMRNQFEFHVTHEKQRRQIEQLYQELMPYSQEPIKEYKVRK